MSEIKIAIACHKPSTLPQNNLYVPIHVGAALSSNTIEGLVRDDTGDNISEKNPTYCELTAQYWAWKNLDADYYGLCHYRRFINFTDTTFTNLDRDNRGQVVAKIMDDYTMHKYGLFDEPRMRKLIEENDIVTTQEMYYPGVNTPYGYQTNLYNHYVAHDRALINMADMDLMIKIVDEKYPEYSADMHEYLSGAYFRGFNCFVMKRELFNELCEFEFDVLAEMEKRCDLSRYNQILTRIYGFMAEHLYSIYIYHLQKKGGYRIAQRQMLLFADTDAFVPPARLADHEDAVSVVIALDDSRGYYMLGVTLSSLFEQISDERFYDIVILADDLPAFFERYYTHRASQRPNVSLRVSNVRKYMDSIAESSTLVADARAYLPYILEHYDRVVVFDDNVLFHADPATLFDIDLGGAILAATHDERHIGMINGIYPEEHDRVTQVLRLAEEFDYFDTSSMVLDLTRMRNRITAKALVARLNSLGTEVSGKDILNVIYEGQVRYLNARWNLYCPTHQWDVDRVHDMPLYLLKEHQAALKNPAIIQYHEQDPWRQCGHEIELEFWRHARTLDFYEMFLGHLAEYRAQPPLPEERPSFARRVTAKIFPYGTVRREYVRKIFLKIFKRRYQQTGV